MRLHTWIAGLLLLAGPIVAADELELPIDFTLCRRLAGQLTSASMAEELEGEKQVGRLGRPFLESLLQAIDQGDWQDRALAARYLRIFVSPWARGLETSFNTQILVPRLRRPAERMVHHAWASEIRKTCWSAMEKIVDRLKSGDPESPDHPLQSEPFLDATLANLKALLAEVADDETIARLAKRLKEESSVASIVYMDLLEYLHGLPPSGLRFNARDAEERAAARDLLLAWHAKHGAEPTPDRIRAALELWDARILKRSDEDPLRFPGLRKCEGLVRLGRDLLPILEERKLSAQTLLLRGDYERLAAFISGRVDSGLVSELLQGDSAARTLACEILRVAGSREWKKELLLQLKDPSRDAAFEACRALVLLHGPETYDRVREALARVKDSSGSFAGHWDLRYLLERLEELRRP